MASIASSPASFASLLLAALLPASRPAPLPALAVLDEQDASRELRVIGAGAPRLLLPVFTRCTGTCPMTAVFLKQALAKADAPFRVVVFSFDPADTAADLRDFRQRFALPEEWAVVRSGDPGATKSFLDGFEFRFMRAGEGFDHPNETFVLSPAGSWTATLTGTSFDDKDLRAAWARAAAADQGRVLSSLLAWLVRPEAWILFACAGLSSSLMAIVIARKRMSRSS